MNGGKDREFRGKSLGIGATFQFPVVNGAGLGGEAGTYPIKLTLVCLVGAGITSLVDEDNATAVIVLVSLMQDVGETASSVSPDRTSPVEFFPLGDIVIKSLF